MSTLRVNTLQTQAGVEVYTAKAWVNFNGTGTVAIRAAGNVSSITDNGTGDYTVNFATAMSDANYSITGLAMISTVSVGLFFGPFSTTSASSARIATTNSSFAVADMAFVQVVIHR